MMNFVKTLGIQKYLDSPLLQMILHKFFKGDERSAKANWNIIQMMVIKGLSILLSLIYVPLFLHCMNNMRYGLWITILSLINWIGFLDIGLGQGLRNRLAEALAKKDLKLSREYIATTYFAVSVVFLVIIAIFLSFYPFFNWSKLVNAPQDIAGEINQTIAIVFCMLSITFIARTFYAISYAVQEPARLSQIGLVSHALCVLSVWIMTLLPYSFRLSDFAWLMMCVPLLVTLFYTVVFFVWRHPELRPSFSDIKSSRIRNILSLGCSFFIIQLTCILLTQCNNLIIANKVSPAAVPEYSLTSKYFQVLFLFFSIVVSPFWSATTDAYVKKDFAWIKKCRRNLEFVFLAFVLLGLCQLLPYKFVFNIWTHGRIEVRSSVAILSYMYICFYMLSSIYISFINGIGKIRFQLYATLGLSVLHITLALWWVAHWGIVGVLMSQVIVYAGMSLWSFLQYRMLLNGTAFGVFNR